MVQLVCLWRRLRLGGDWRVWVVVDRGWGAATVAAATMQPATTRQWLLVGDARHGSSGTSTSSSDSNKQGAGARVASFIGACDSSGGGGVVNGNGRWRSANCRRPFTTTASLGSTSPARWWRSGDGASQCFVALRSVYALCGAGDARRVVRQYACGSLGVQLTPPPLARYVRTEASLACTKARCKPPRHGPWVLRARLQALQSTTALVVALGC